MASRRSAVFSRIRDWTGRTTYLGITLLLIKDFLSYSIREIKISSWALLYGYKNASKSLEMSLERFDVLQ